jgi:hypothetical protein
MLIVLMGLAGCATTRAQGPIVMEPLQVPPVPPRVIVPDIEEVAPGPGDPADTPRPASKPDTPAKPPEKPADPPPPPASMPPPATTAESAPRVRTPQTANDEASEREVRAIMARAQAMLRNVDYRNLSAAARQQYDTARRFITQAESALRIRNYVFARNLADKAETLARQLGK